MGIRSVSKIERVSRFRQLAGTLATLLWTLLLLAGLVASLPVVMFLIVLLTWLILLLFGRAETDPATFRNETDTMLDLLPVGLVSATCMVVGMRLRRGKRRLVLFLRRFGLRGRVISIGEFARATLYEEV